MSISKEAARRKDSNTAKVEAYLRSLPEGSGATNKEIALALGLVLSQVANICSNLLVRNKVKVLNYVAHKGKIYAACPIHSPGTSLIPFVRYGFWGI